MLARLHMTVSEAIDAYLSLSKIVFAPNHRFNKIATLVNVSRAQGRVDTSALEREIKTLVSNELGGEQQNALLMEENPVCHG
jgi:hypothetical protein